MMEESRTAQPAAGPDSFIDSDEGREGELLRDVRRQKNERAECEAQFLGIGQTKNLINPEPQEDSNEFANYAAK